MSDVYDALNQATSAPLPQSLSALRMELEKAKRKMLESQSHSEHWERWSQRKNDIQGVIDTALIIPSFGRNAISINTPLIDTSYAQQILNATESDILEFKRQLPSNLRTNRISRGVLLKDIQAIANSVTDRIGHIFYGKANSGALEGISEEEEIDDADIQHWAENAIEPQMDFTVHYVEINNTKVCLIVIKPATERPHVAKQTVDQNGERHKGQVWYRQGTRNKVASFHDLNRLFGAERSGPIHFETLNDSSYRILFDWFQSLGQVLFCGRLTQKDELIGQDYKIALHPLSSQEIHIGSDSMLFLRPIND